MCAMQNEAKMEFLVTDEAVGSLKNIKIFVAELEPKFKVGEKLEYYRLRRRVIDLEQTASRLKNNIESTGGF